MKTWKGEIEKDLARRGATAEDCKDKAKWAWVVKMPIGEEGAGGAASAQRVIPPPNHRAGGLRGIFISNQKRNRLQGIKRIRNQTEKS